MRSDDFSRRLMREHTFTPSDLIYPVFVLDGRNRRKAVASIPGVERLPVAKECTQLGILALTLFPVIDAGLKTLDTEEALIPDGLVRRTPNALKKCFPELGVITDIALDCDASHIHTRILAHAAKYDSSVCGPFRDAVGSAANLGNGNKFTYQMDPANSDESLWVFGLDLQENGDMVMDNLGMSHLNVILRVKDTYDTLPMPTKSAASVPC